MKYSGYNNDDGTKMNTGKKIPEVFKKSIQEEFLVSDVFNKVPVLIVFFATWCGACLEELIQLQKYILKKYASRGLKILAVGREQKAENLAEFNKSNQFDFSLIADPERKLYDLFASKFIPRNILIGKDGIIKYQSVGYQQDDLIRAIEKEL